MSIPLSHRPAPARRAAVALKLAAGIAVLAAGVGSVMFLSNAKEAKADKGSGGLTADRAVAKPTSFDIVTTASGDLEAKKQIEIRSTLEVTSAIVKVVDEGITVKKGDVLVELNSDKINTQIADEQIALDSANAEKMTTDNNYKIQLTDNETKIRQATLKIELAELSLEQWQKGDVEKMRQANALALEKTGRDLKRLIEKYDRSKELFEKGFLSKNDFQLDEISKLEAQSAVSKAELESLIYETYMFPKEKKKNQSDVDDAKAELERTKLNAASELANKEAALAKAVNQHKQRQENLDKFKKQRAACTVVAPSDGLVVYGSTITRSRGWWSNEGPLQIGSEVNNNMLLMALPDTAEMIASVKVQANLAGRLKPGQLATIRVDDAGGLALNGKVESIGVLAESSGWRDSGREYTVKIALDGIDPASGLKPSMRCEAEITTGRVENALTIPVQAIFNDGAVCYVYTPQGQKYARTPVKLGRASDANSEIISGITEGQVVLLREPTAGEVLARPWDKAQLEKTGYVLGDDGIPYLAGKEPKNGKGRASKSAPKAPGTPSVSPGVTPDAASPVPDASKPAETSVEKLTEKPIEKPAEKPTEAPAEQPAVQPVTDPAPPTTPPKKSE